MFSCMWQKEYTHQNKKNVIHVKRNKKTNMKIKIKINIERTCASYSVANVDIILTLL